MTVSREVLDAFMGTDTFRDSIPNPDEFRELDRADKYQVAAMRYSLLAPNVDLDIEEDDDTAEKEWVPYTGPEGGEGWRSTVNQVVRYQDEKPETQEFDVDDITAADVEQAAIHETTTWVEADIADLRDGDPVRYITNDDYQWEGQVTEITDEAVHIETDSERQLQVDRDANGDPKERLRRPLPVSYGYGVAGAEHSWLPEDESANDAQLQAEALRSAAANDGFEETIQLESFVALTLERGEGEDRVRSTMENAIREDPMLHEAQADKVWENGQKLRQIASNLADDTSVEEKYKRLIERDWVPYEGPYGGEGWQDLDTGEVRYQTDPPGNVDDEFEEDFWDDGDPHSDLDWKQPPDDPSTISPGQAVQIEMHAPDGASLTQEGQVESVGYDDNGLLEITVTHDNGRFTHQPDNPLSEITATKPAVEVAAPGWANIEDIKGGLREVDLYGVVSEAMIRDGDLSWNSKDDVLTAANKVITDSEIEGVNRAIVEHANDQFSAEFETPFGATGPDIHTLLEDTFGRYSDIVSDLEDQVLFDSNVDEENPESWIRATEEWITENGNPDYVEMVEDALTDYSPPNPFEDVNADLPDGMDPSNADTVATLSDAGTDGGISEDSMFIAEYDDGSRAFVTNTNMSRANEHEIGAEGRTDSQRALIGYETLQAAGWDVPHHERVDGEFWVVEEAPGVSAKEWDGDPDQIDRDEFYRLGACAFLTGNWDFHGGNVFVTDDGDLVPVDLDLSGYAMNEFRWRKTSWGRLERLGDSLGILSSGDRADVSELEEKVKEKTEELVNDGTADRIKSAATNTDNMVVQMNIEENVFAAKRGDLYE